MKKDKADEANREPCESDSRKFVSETSAFNFQHSANREIDPAGFPAHTFLHGKELCQELGLTPLRPPLSIVTIGKRFAIGLTASASYELMLIERNELMA